MLKRMEFKTIALDTKEGHLNTDRIYQLGYLLYETDTNIAFYIPLMNVDKFKLYKKDK